MELPLVNSSPFTQAVVEMNARIRLMSARHKEQHSIITANFITHKKLKFVW
jgi:hypothetical protein